MTSWLSALESWELPQLGVQACSARKYWQSRREDPPIEDGSSHGATRIFRQAYWEGQTYLGLLSLADRGWRELQSSSETRLIIQTGGLFIGPRKTGVITGSLSTAAHGKVEHEHLTTAVIRERFPQFLVDDDMEAVYEPGAYAVLAEEARLQMLNEAVSRGTQLAYGEEVEAIASNNGRPTITTRAGRTVAAGSILACAGAANAALLPELASVLHPKRVPIYWFKPRLGYEEQFGQKVFPVFLYEAKDGALLYGIAAGMSAETGVKIGFHNRQHVTHTANADPAPALNSYEREIESYISAIFPGLVPATANSKWCVYTMTPDESFVLDQSSKHPNVFLANACSGHGFKFAPAIGQILAEQGMGFRLSVDLGAFVLDRFGGRASVATDGGCESRA